MLPARIRYWTRHLLRRTKVDDDLDEELRACVDIMAADAIESGASREEALRRARLTLGGLEATKEQVRDALPASSLHSLRRDVHYALRYFVRRPLFTAAAVLSLALGIGAATAAYSWGRHMFQAPPGGVSDPAGLINVFVTEADAPDRYTLLSLPHYLEMRDAQTVLSGMAGSFRYAVSLGLSDGAREETIELVTGSFFSTIGVPMLAGRGIEETDDVAGGPSSVVLSSHLARQLFGDRTMVLGETVRLNGQPFTVVGVVAPAFDGIEFNPYGAPSLWAAVHAYTPLVGTDRVTRRSPLLLAYGRLKPGVTREAADASLNAVAQHLSYVSTDTRRFAAVRTFPLRRLRTGLAELQAFFVIALMVAGLVLAVGCCNISSLLMTQGISRQSELGLRLAIGASRRRVFGQLLIECVVLGAIGGALGIACAFGFSRLIEAYPPITLLGYTLKTPAGIDLRALAFAGTITAATVLAFGLLPAVLISSRSPMAGTLAMAQWFSPRRSVARQAILALQVSLSTLLTILAALFAVSLARVDAQEYPYAMDDILLARLSPGALTPAARQTFYRQLLAQIRARGDVASAALSVNPLLTIGSAQVSSTRSPQGVPADFTQIGADYFKTLQVTLVAGREMTDEETQAVTILNRTLAERLWPGETAVGRTVYFPNLPPVGVPYTVVGVVDHPRCQDQMTVREFPCVYRPIRLYDSTPLTLQLRTTTAPSAFFDDLRRTVASLSADVVLDRTTTLTGYLATARTGPRVAVVMTAATASIASLLSVIGCAALLLALVGEARRELTIRAVLGASPAHMRAFILGHAVVPFVCGMALGTGAAWVLAARFSQQLFQTSPHDPLAFSAPTIALLIAAAVASAWPLYRVGRLDSAHALRA